MQISKNWDWELGADPIPFQKTIPILYKYKDLLVALVSKELTASYQQTLIGYAWLLFQPLLTTLFYFMVFGHIVKINTMGIPPLLFYMSGSIIWSYFADTMLSTMYTFVHQAHIFQKIYFPRLIVPLAMVINHSIRFGIQFVLFIFIYIGWIFIYDGFNISLSILLLPLLFLQVALFSMGLGLIVSVYMSKYKDLEFFVQFLMRLFIFVTPIIYPASMVPPAYKILYWLNPLTPIVEIFRSIFFTHQYFSIMELVPGILITILVFFYGVTIFQKKEKSIMDII